MYRSTEYLISNIQYPIIDIGAHIGVFSLYSYVLNPKSYVIALEPEPNNYRLLEENLRLNNCKNVKPIHAALIAGNDLNTKLYLSKNSHNHSTVKQSGNLTIQQFNNSTITVPAISLERLIKKYKLKTIGLLKMDIEGAEFEIVLNIEHETWSKIQYAVIEYHESEKNRRADLENTIRQQGFSIEHFPNKFDKRFGLLV